MKSELWIESLKVENLGPFVGRKTFNFGRSSEESLTCILGGSGSGKTFLVNALCWAFDLPAPAISGRFASPVNENSDYFSVEVVFQIGGISRGVKRNSLSSQDFVAPEVPVIYFDDQLASSALEEEFLSNGGHGSGALLVYALTKFLDDLQNKGDCRPLVFDAVFGILDLSQQSEAVDALFSYPAQIILCGDTHGCRELLDRGRAIRVLEI